MEETLKKRAIVLLVTVGFIAIITAIIYQTVAISKKSFDDLMSLKRQNQLMLLVIDSTKMIDSMNKEYLDEFLKSETQIPFQDEKSGLSLTFSCISLKTRFNLDKLISCKKNECKNVIYDYAKSKELGSESFFYELLKKHKMNNLNDLKNIKELYLADTRDFYIENVNQEDFEKYFFISDLNISSKKDFMPIPTQEICKLFELENDESSCKKKFHNITKNFYSSKTNNQNNIKDLIKCKINLYNGPYKNGSVFKYNIKTKKIVSIDEFF